MFQSPLRWVFVFALTLTFVPRLVAEPTPLKLLYLGDAGHHQPLPRFHQLAPVLAARGIQLTYTDRVADLNPQTLGQYDGLVIFANHTDWTPENEKALLDFVASGKGFIPLHCASYCFIKSQAYIDLVGAQFRSHTTGVFRTQTTAPDHPIMKGVESFQSWDETYVHHKHNTKDRVVLEVRKEGDLAEPWTWVRTHGQGRVFYTAWGHDHRTWSHPGFHTLVERGIRWACNKGLETASVHIDRPKMTEFAKDAKPLEFAAATLPFYPPGERWGVQREPIKTMQKPLAVEESLKHYSTPVEFEMRPFVTEEKLGGGKPICMTWDEEGRLWLALTYDYPNELKRDGEGRDKVVICEDVDGDGRCDNVRVFAEKLSIPTSLLNVYGGLLVHSAPHTLFLKDTNGDGVADVRQVLFSGWGTNDTHAGPSNLRYGPDNWIYGMCGYSGFAGTVGNESIRFGQGLYRFKLENTNGLRVTKLEFLRSTNNNSWGVGFNEQGQLFGSTANGCPLVHLTVPNRYYEKIRGLTPSALANIVYDNHVEPVVKDYRQVDWHGGFTAGAGCEIYTARTYPKEYWNSVAFVCEPTAHLAAALVLHPTGSSYTARYGWNLVASRDDWAAPIDTRVGPDGHMWVMDWYNIIVQHNPTPRGFETGKGNAYESPYRDKQFGRVYRVVYTKAKPEPRVNLKDATNEKLRETLTHHNLAWRLHAQRILVERGQAPADKPLAIQSNQSSKLADVLAMADSPSDEHGPKLAAALLDPVLASDVNLQHAVTIAAAVNASSTLTALAKLEAPKSALPSIELVARNLKVADASPLLIALSNSKSPAVANAILQGLAAASKPTSPLSPDGQKALAQLIASSGGTSRGRWLNLANTWGVKGLETQLGELTKELFATLANENASETSRIEAAKQIVEFQPDNEDAASKLIGVVTAKTSPTLSNAILDALTVSKSKSIGSALVTKIKDLPQNVKPLALRLILARPDSAAVFLDSVEKGELRFDLLQLEQKTALATHPNAAIANRAKKLLAMGGGLPDANRQKVIDELHTLLTKTGNVGNGKKAFVQHCAKCHKHGGEGQTIGPDLTGFAVHPKDEILIHVMDPSRSVEGNYKAYTASLADGRVLTGLLSSETRTSIELLDAENKRHAIARDDLESLKESPKSLMPEGFEKQMKPEELVDLLEFLTQKGKYVPIPLDKAATIVSTKGMFISLDADVERLIFRDWTPKEFKGVPFYLVDPQGDKAKNAVMLYSTNGTFAKAMPKSVSLPCNTTAKAIHLLGGVGGWAWPFGEHGSVSMIVKLNYDDGTTEQHPLKNGVHIADYIRRVNVPQSEFAFALRGQQIRYLSITPKHAKPIKSIELVKGPDDTVPVVMAVTIETP